MDGDSLMKDARMSEHGESYRIVVKRESFMVAAGARATKGRGEYFLEVTVQLCLPSSKVDIRSIEGALPILKELSSRGYSMECREGSITCERVLAAAELGPELELVSAGLKRLR